MFLWHQKTIISAVWVQEMPYLVVPNEIDKAKDFFLIGVFLHFIHNMSQRVIKKTGYVVLFHDMEVKQYC